MPPDSTTLRFKRSNYWLVALFLTITTAVLGLSSGQANASAPLRMDVPLTGSAAFDNTFAGLVKKFNHSHHGFRIELIQRGDAFSTLRTIIASRYAGELPALAVVDSADVVTLKKLNVLQPFPAKWVAKKAFNKELMRKRNSKTVLSIPFQRRVAAWYFNRELLFKLGKPTKEIPLDWLHLSQFSRSLHRNKTRKSSNVLWGIALPAIGQPALECWTALGLGPLSNPAASATQWVTKMWKSKADLIPGGLSADEATRRFLNQRAVILLGTMDQWNYIKKNAPFKFAAILPPGKLLWFGNDFVLTAKGKNAIRARQFLDYIYSPSNYLKLERTALSLPLGRSTLEVRKWKLLEAALKRTFRSMGLDSIPPQIRSRWTMTLWHALQNVPNETLRKKAGQKLKANLEKILSRNRL